MSEVNSVLEKEKQRETGEMKWGGYVSVFIGMAITTLIERFSVKGHALKL